MAIGGWRRTVLAGLIVSTVLFDQISGLHVDASWLLFGFLASLAAYIIVKVRRRAAPRLNGGSHGRERVPGMGPHIP